MNIVVLLNETHTYDYLGCAGFPMLQTPTADALAADGVMFEQAVCATTPCLPSRHNILHGLHAFQTGIYSNRHAMPLDQIPDLTMGSAFKQAGYATAACGKMHLFPYGIAMERGNHFGFDYRAGHFYESGESMDTHYVAERRDFVELRRDESSSHGVSKGGDGCAQDYVGYDSALRNDQGMDWWTSQESASFIDANNDSPFLVINSLVYPHTPNAVPADFVDLYDPDEVRLPALPSGELLDREMYLRFKGVSPEDLKTIVSRYMACVTATDACHALVIDALKRNGLYDDTLIVFVADHGDLMGSRGLTGFSKYNLYEGAIRVPFIIKPPKSLGDCAVGRREGTPVSLIDVLPTILDIAGLPGQGHLSGTSLKPLLLGQPLVNESPITVTEFWTPPWSTPTWARGKVCTSVRTEEWKLTIGAFGDELYDLGDDPNEFRNLGQEPGQASRIAAMKAQLVDYYRSAFDRSSRKRLDYESGEWSFLDS